jgi:hypothetical protein
MKRKVFAAKLLLLLAIVMSMGCIGISRSELVDTPVAETLTAVAVEQPSHATLPVTPAPKIALVSFHGRYVTAQGEDDDWVLKQEPELSECGWFTQHRLENGKIALLTCHGRYVYAPRRGTTRWDWQLWQESGLGDCGQFKLHRLQDGIAFETCAGNFFTAGDGNWDAGLQWSIVAETDKLDDWEWFTVLER